MAGFPSVYSLDDLREFVHQTLCAKENLLPDQSPVTEMPLTRAGRVCGVQFHVRGPRAVRLSAIWAADLNVVYFYDACGTRYQKVQLRYRFGMAAAA